MFQTTKQFYMAFIPWVHWVHPTCLGIRTDMTLGSAPFTNWITPTYPIAGMYIMNNIKKNWLRTVIIFSTHWAHSVMKCRSRSSPSWRVATETTTWCRMMSRFFGGCPNTLDLTEVGIWWNVSIFCGLALFYMLAIFRLRAWTGARPAGTFLTDGTAEVSHSLGTEDWHIWEEQAPQNQPPVNKIHQDVETQYSVYN